MRKRFMITVMAVLLAGLLVHALGTGPSAWADPGTPPKCPPGQSCK
jgi:hypothetical protein